MKIKLDKKQWTLIIVCSLMSLFIFWVITEYRKHKERMRMWEMTYVNNETKPFDTYICYDLLKDLQGKDKVVSTRRSIYQNLIETFEDDYDYDYNYNSEYQEVEGDYDIADVQVTGFSDDSIGESKNNSDLVSIVESEDVMMDTITYLFISSNFKLETADKDYIYNFIESGNNLFVAAENYDYSMMQHLGISMHSESLSDSIYYMLDNKDRKYNISLGWSNESFKIDDCKYPIRVLANNKQGNPIFIQIKYGKGNIYLHSIPTAFTNQTLIKTRKYDFAFRCLSYIPKSNSILWDEYQTQGPINTSISELLKVTPLRLAVIITVIGMFIFVLFRIKRVQRVIPIVKPPVNSSVEFLETISSLYYKKKDFKIIADKRHAYLLDFIRKHYYMSTENINEEFISSLSAKSQFEKDKLSQLFDLYDSIKLYDSISNEVFMNYCNLLEEFYRTTKK